MKLIVYFLGILQMCLCQKVYDWQRDWTSNQFTKEFVQVSDADRRVLYSAVDSSVRYNVPAVALHDYQFSSKKFENGIMALRPLLSAGNQVCFINKLSDSDWSSVKKKLANRHGTTISKNVVTTVQLHSRLPGGLDPLSLQSIADFCDVARDHIFYLRPNSDLSTFNKKIKLQGVFNRFHIGIPDAMVSKVLGS